MEQLLKRYRNTPEVVREWMEQDKGEDTHEWLSPEAWKIRNKEMKEFDKVLARNTYSRNVRNGHI